MYNPIQRQRRTGNGEAESALQYLKEQSKSDSAMYWRHSVDEEGKLQQLFWADGCSIFDYSIFGDVLAFDATYGRNKYKFAVVIFSGVNHHKQTIVFVDGIVSNETEKTYVWLLGNLLEAMNGKHPKCVITDGDLSMNNAIKRVFPAAHHRLCAWHICNNAEKNIKNNNFHKDFQKVMYADVEIDDVNMMWEELIAKQALHNNVWASQIFDCKSMWARLYIRGKFYPGLHTTSRCEGLHSQMGRYIESGYNVTEYLHHFQRCRQRRIGNGDAESALHYLKEQSKSDSAMYWRHSVDEEGKLQQLFWADGCSIFDYSIFGDVLAFDATYGRNKYKFPVVIFSGVNHHKQKIVFVDGIVSNETEKTYVWLLGNLLEAMNGKHPKCVITDGDLSMKNAIKRVFPAAHHRLCVCHICNKAGKNIKKNNFHKDFQKVMYADVEIDDFNMMWVELIAKQALHNNVWASQIFDCKSMWIQRRIGNGDAESALQYLKEQLKSDSAMYWRHSVDEEGKLQQLFWADGCSIFDYSIFGDVLAFDATYGRNKYKFPVVIFSGVNHHKQTIVFADGIVSNEAEKTYVWLLGNLLEAMNGKHPKCVITDGDLSMKNAIKRVFPATNHRLCAWHICNNVGKNIKKNNFHKDFQKVMYADVVIDDFNMMSEELIAKQALHNNVWASRIFDCKSMWARSYIRGKFYPGLHTTSPCEGLHSQMGALQYLKEQSKSDSAMYWRHSVDEEGKLQQLFWADGCSIFDYSIFGDVLAFDATYGRNKYKFSVVIFSGVNHHKQTIVFADGIVSNETEKTYVWLLGNLLEAMNGKHPKCVITDGDLSMKNAIKRVFPAAHHRLCAWHICNNAGKNIKKNNFHKNFQKVMYADVEIDDFNMMWEELIAKQALHNNVWASQIFDCKSMWARSYIRGKFYPGLHTTSRCEGLHSQMGRHSGPMGVPRPPCEGRPFRSKQGEKQPGYLVSMATGAMTRTLEVSTKIWPEKKKSLHRHRPPFENEPVQTVPPCPAVTIGIATAFRESFLCDALSNDPLSEPTPLLLRTKKAKNIEGVNFQQCELSRESVKTSRYGALSDACRVLCNLACETEEDFSEMLEKVYNECSRLRSKQHSSSMENADNATVNQVRDSVRVCAKGRVPGITSRPKRGNQCGICREIGHNRASCPNVVGSCSRTFDNDFDE
ncbi:hypothetical protein Lal_00004185 [Lupinus albus]|nr:hypothetical protein Lal_00004185 [Lupinus albus]